MTSVYSNYPYTVSPTFSPLSGCVLIDPSNGKKVYAWHLRDPSAEWKCRGRRIESDYTPTTRRSDWQTDGGALHPTNNNNNGASCLNDAYDFQDETDPRRLEQRRVARERQLESAEVQGQISLKTIDRSAASALAVEQLLRDSYVFDTKLMPRPPGDIRVIAAKRDYL